MCLSLFHIYALLQKDFFLLQRSYSNITFSISFSESDCDGTRFLSTIYFASVMTHADTVPHRTTNCVTMCAPSLCCPVFPCPALPCVCPALRCPACQCAPGLTECDDIDHGQRYFDPASFGTKFKGFCNLGAEWQAWMQVKNS